LKADTAAAALNEAVEPNPKLSEHIFAYQDGEIEVSKEFLRRLLKFFEVPENRKHLDEGERRKKARAK
jgi:hypothetical protein